MKPILIATIILAVAMAAAADEKKANALIQAAQAKETVQGDLKAAIGLYGQAVKEAGANRALAAKSLLRMAECYQKMGDAEARKIYEQVVRDYVDQKEAVALARARLGTPAISTSGGSIRQVWARAGGSPYGPISHDGRYVAFTTRGRGSAPNLAVHDLATGADLVLTHSEDIHDHPTRTNRAFSPDSRQIAYIWVINYRNDREERSEVRISELNGNSSKGRVLFGTGDRLEADDWSPDGKWIALQIFRKDRTRQLGLVSTKDGSLRVLKTIDWAGSTGVYFSPDSRYLAFDLPSGENSEKRDVFVLAVDGSREIPAVVHPADDWVAGWTPDGKHLLFFSDRNGLTSLWRLAFEGGRPQGNPEMMRPNFGGNVTEYLGPTRSGEIYYVTLGGGVKVSVAAVDLASGKAIPGSLRQFTENIYPAWSPDGKYLAYSSYQLPSGGDTSLAIRSLETGQSRELRPKVKYPTWPSWSPDGRSLLVQATDLKGRGGIFRVDAQTAEVETIAIAGTDEALVTPQWLPDGKRVLYERSARGGDSAIVERELISGKESEIVRVKSLPELLSFTRGFAVSPDGRSLAYVTSDGTTAHTAIMMMPLAGGQPRELLKLSGLTLGGWTPDSQSLLYSRLAGEALCSGCLPADIAPWLLPVNGGQPRNLDLGEHFVTQMQMHPDGKRVVFWSNNQTAEQVWVLENYLPTLSASR